MLHFTYAFVNCVGFHYSIFMFASYNRLMHVCILICFWQMECAALMSLRASKSRTGECKGESFEECSSLLCYAVFIFT
jgi:hypothetical protein